MPFMDVEPQEKSGRSGSQDWGKNRHLLSDDVEFLVSKTI